MATNTQRVQSIVNALINGTATPVQINRIGLGLSKIPSAASANYETMTNAEKQTFILAQLRQIVISQIKQYDVIEAARVAPAPNPAAVDAEFTETP